MENQNKELLKVEHLKKYFNTPGGVLHAVDDVSFSIRAGETSVSYTHLTLPTN